MRFCLFTFVIVTTLTALTHSQNFIPEDRIIDWNPGIEEGIPEYPVGVNINNFGATGDGITDDSQSFLDAIEACPDNHAVFIPAGTYLITNRLLIEKPIAVRGAGPDQTFLIFELQPDAMDYQRTNFWLGNSSTDISVGVIGGCNKGSNEIKVTDITGFNVGDLIEIRQDNDPEIMARPIVPPEQNDSWAEGHWGWRAVGQFLLITDINESTNTISLHHPLYFDYNIAMNPEITRHPEPAQNAGIEDLHMELMVDCNGYYGNIQMMNTVNCWVKNVRSYKCSRSHIGIWGGLGNVVRDCYFEYSHGYAGGQGYAVNLIDRATDNLIENNIFDYLQGKMLTAVGTCGNVYGYNYGRRTLDDLGDWEDMHACMAAHGHHANMNLFEGNSGNKAAVDRYWGSNANYVLLRNKMLCPDGYVRSSIPANIEKNNINMTFIGNVLHHELSTENRTVWSFPDEPDDFAETDLTMNTLILHGNYDYMSENTFWDSQIEDRTIPNSYYLDKKPDFFANAPWGDTPWPNIGPDVLHEKIIPAQQRFCDLNGISPPNAPANLSAEADMNRITLSWDDNSDNEHCFRIEQSIDGFNFERIAATNSDSTKYTVLNLESYSTYYFRVCSYFAEAGNSSFSDVVSATTRDEEDENIIAWYTFDMDATDSSDNGYHGELNGTVITTGRVNQGLEFNGINSMVTVPTWDSPLDGNDEPFTISAWIYPEDVTVNNWVVSDDAPWGNFLFGLKGDKVYVKWIQVNNERYSLESVEYPTVKANTFSHIAASYDPVNRIVRLYLNGKQVAIDRYTQPQGAYIFDVLQIGCGSESGEMEYFDGIIDDLKINNQTLAFTPFDIEEIPSGFYLSESFPNPFFPETSFDYNLPVYCRVKIDVYDIMGRKICNIRDERQLAGSYSFEWDGFNDMNHYVPMGIYFIIMNAGPYKATRKVLFFK